MNHEPSMDANELRRQLLTHLRQWRGAGIDWVPHGSALHVAPSSKPAPATPATISTQTSAFEIAVDDGPGADLPSLEERRIALTTLAAEVKTCTRCTELCSTRTQTVFADGPVGAELCFVGEAPGADEDAQGLPFVGAAGQLLNKIIAASGFKREEVYICNILKCRPPGNRTPLAHEAANCRGFLERQLALVAPKFIVALGGCAATNLLQTTLSIAKLRGRFHDFKGASVMVTYHPAYLLPHKSPEKKREVWDDMKMLVKKMGRTLPAGP
jgi:uracil-DNA glycosylase